MPIMKINLSHPLPRSLHKISQDIDWALRKGYYSRDEGAEVQVVVPMLSNAQKQRLRRRYKAAGWNVKIKTHNRNFTLLFLFS